MTTRRPLNVSRTCPLLPSICIVLNSSLLASARKCERYACSVVPKELEVEAQAGKGTDVKLVDKRNEEYVAPAYVAFGGDGQTMG